MKEWTLFGLKSGKFLAGHLETFPLKKVCVKGEEKWGES